MRRAPTEEKRMWDTAVRLLDKAQSELLALLEATETQQQEDEPDDPR